MFQLTFRNGYVVPTLFETKEKALDAFKLYSNNYEVELHGHKVMPVGRLVTDEPIGTILPVVECPVQVVGTTQTLFPLGQLFLVLFSRKWSDFQALDVMTLYDIIQMIDDMDEEEFPYDLYFTEFEYEEIEDKEDMVASYTAAPVTQEWIDSFPFVLPVGHFIDML